MPDKTILVIEDNAMNMKLMRAVLTVGQYRMVESGDAETGIRLARENRPDLILMDIQLPGMDGVSATRIIKADPQLQHIPVLAMTGYAMEEEKRKAMDAGFAGYVVKPFHVAELLATIAHSLQNPQPGSQPG
jgi:two-component system cell cycle response regulator DivK